MKTNFLITTTSIFSLIILWLYFLQCLRQYFEYYLAFKRVDRSDDDRISLQEFKEQQNLIERWVGVFNAEDEFRKIDTNDGGTILFDEFCNWALRKNNDLEDDDDEDLK